MTSEGMIFNSAKYLKEGAYLVMPTSLFESSLSKSSSRPVERLVVSEPRDWAQARARALNSSPQYLLGTNDRAA